MNRLKVIIDILIRARAFHHIIHTAVQATVHTYLHIIMPNKKWLMCVYMRVSQVLTLKSELQHRMATV